MPQIKEPPPNRAKRTVVLNAPRISDSTSAAAEQLLNDAIHELVLAIHHSPNPFLLGTTGIATVRDETSNVDVIPPGANLVVAGSFGTIDNTTLDGGGSSAHGYLPRNQLPPSASAFLSIGGNPNQVVAFSYPLGWKFLKN